MISCTKESRALLIPLALKRLPEKVIVGQPLIKKVLARSRLMAAGSWFHFLCKRINRAHDNPFWLKSGYFLKSDDASNVTLICFEASDSLKRRFRNSTDEVWQGFFEAPFSLFPPILSDLHYAMDEQVWESINPIRELEAVS